MAYVICVCGAGGKTTYCQEIANKKALANKKVCILTTTHMWKDRELSNIDSLSEIRCGLVYFFGDTDGEKVIFVGDKQYKKICEKFEFVIIETDGSRGMPIKIPRFDREPNIPDNVNEIIVVYGKQAINRKLGVVCHRFNEFFEKDSFISKNSYKFDTSVTLEIYEKLRKHYYIEPLQNKFPETQITTYDVDFIEYNYYMKIRKVALVICASGFSTRFGDDDKLKVLIKNKKMYELMIDKLVYVKNNLIKKFQDEINYKLDVDIAITVRTNLFDEVSLYGKNKGLITILNENASEGLSSSIKISTKKFFTNDAIMFINCDLPYLNEIEIMNFVFYSICNKSDISAMYTDEPKNPAYFEKKYFKLLLELNGDKGARELIKENKQHLYRYYIDKYELTDIDLKEDLIV